MRDLRLGNACLGCYISAALSALYIVEAKTAGHHSGLDSHQPRYTSCNMGYQSKSYLGWGWRHRNRRTSGDGGRVSALADTNILVCLKTRAVVLHGRIPAVEVSKRNPCILGNVVAVIIRLDLVESNTVACHARLFVLIVCCILYARWSFTYLNRRRCCCPRCGGYGRYDGRRRTGCICSSGS